MTFPDKAAIEFVDMIMNAIDDEAFALGPGAVRQALIDFVGTGQATRRLVSHEHPLAEESNPRKIKLEFSIRRDETEDEREAREKDAERRLAILLWRPEQGPPPKGVEFSRLREQTTWWAPKKGEPVKIADMADSHRRNLIAYLERNAEGLKDKAYMSLMLTMPEDPPDGLAAALNGRLSEMEQATGLDWLNRQPLVKKLRKLDKKARKNERVRA